MFEVEIVYAAENELFLLNLKVPPGTCAIEAIQQSGLLNKFPHLQKESLAMGIYGKRIEPKQQLKPFDRLEIYRPLLIDPKDARRKKATKPQ